MLQHTTLYIALGIPYLDPAYPYIIHQPPSSPVTTQPYVTIIVSDIPDSPPLRLDTSALVSNSDPYS